MHFQYSKADELHFEEPFAFDIQKFCVIIRVEELVHPQTQRPTMVLKELSDDEAITKVIAYYDQCAEVVASQEHPLPWDDPMLKQVRQLMLKDPLVLDIGCGSGRAIPLFQKLGITRHIGVDASEGMLKIARKKYPDVDLRLGDVRDLSAVFTEKFDGFLYSSSLMCIPRGSLEKALRSIRFVMKRGAIGFIATSSGFGTQFLTQRDRPGVIPQGHVHIMESWGLRELSELLERSSFQVVDPVNDNGSMLFATVRAR